MRLIAILNINEEQINLIKEEIDEDGDMSIIDIVSHEMGWISQSGIYVQDIIEASGLIEAAIKQDIEDYNYTGKHNLTEEQKDAISTKLLNDDYVWQSYNEATVEYFDEIVGDKDV